MYGFAAGHEEVREYLHSQRLEKGGPLRVGCVGARGISRTQRREAGGLGRWATTCGCVLVTGGCRGADQAYTGHYRYDLPDPVAVQVGARLEVCLPWPEYEDDYIQGLWRTMMGRSWPGSSELELSGRLGSSPLMLTTPESAVDIHLMAAAGGLGRSIGGRYGPFFMRNAQIVLGPKPPMTKLDVLLAMPDTDKPRYGGTGHTMRVALAYDVPIWWLDRDVWVLSQRGDKLPGLYGG